VAHDEGRVLASDWIAPALATLGGLQLVIDAYADATRHHDELVRRGATLDLFNLVWREGTGYGGQDLNDLTADELGVLHAVLNAAATDPSPHVRSNAGRAVQLLENPEMRHA
jgi:hypothetical protein